MKLRRFRLLGFLLLVSPAIAAAADDLDPTPAIRSVLDKQVDCWNRKDLDGFLEGYWHSQKLVFQSGPTRSDGFDAMRDRYRARYQAEGKAMGTLEFSGIEVIPLAPDTAFVRGRWQLTLSQKERPGGLFTLILRKLPEGWRIVHDHTSS